MAADVLAPPLQVVPPSRAGDLHAYQLLINAGVVVYYTGSPDGMNWSPLTVLYDFRNEKDHPSVYVAFVGMGDDPGILGKKFYIFYTRYPNNGDGWNGASVNRFTVSCQLSSD